MSSQPPLILGPFAVDAEGRLAPARDDCSPGFSVRWRGRVVHARLADGSLAMETVLGRVASSARDVTARTDGLKALRAMTRTLPAGWRLTLMADHRPRLETAAVLPMPVTVTRLVTELTAFLLELSPWLDWMDEVGVV
jgi:hypothetical protein